MEFIDPLITFFKDIWSQIINFLTRYMPIDVVNVLLFAILLAVGLIVILAIMNRRN